MQPGRIRGIRNGDSGTEAHPNRALGDILSAWIGGMRLNCPKRDYAGAAKIRWLWKLMPCQSILLLGVENYSCCPADGDAFVARKKPAKGMRVRPLMSKYKVSRFE